MSRTTTQFIGCFEPNLVLIDGQVFLPTGSAAPTLRYGGKGLKSGSAAVVRESAGVIYFQASRPYPSGSLMFASLNPWCSGTVPSTISYDLKHVDETNPNGARVYFTCLSGTSFPTSVQDPSIHLTGSFQLIFRDSKVL